ncbi:MAG: hypothetical protein M5R40_00120 [Anaerolineae bacterium]|nr:hypothetical protein [Anaerolineae bacterium]
MIPTLIRAWFWLHLASLAAIALQPSTQGVVLGRYSTSAALALVAFVVLTPVVWFGTRWLAGRVEQVSLSRRGYAAALLAASGALFVLWALPASPTSSHIVIRLYLTFVLFTAALWSLERVRLPPGRATCRGRLAWGASWRCWRSRRASPACSGPTRASWSAARWGRCRWATQRCCISSPSRWKPTR